MRKFFGSRKYTTAILTALFIAMNDALDLGFTQETLQLMVATLGTWIVGEAATDMAGALSRKKEEPK